MLLGVSARYGDALHRGDVDEITMLTAALDYIVRHTAQQLKEKDFQSTS